MQTKSWSFNQRVEADKSSTSRQSSLYLELQLAIRDHEHNAAIQSAQRDDEHNLGAKPLTKIEKRCKAHQEHMSKLQRDGINLQKEPDNLQVKSDATDDLV